MQYDCVWYTPENKARALELVRRLPREEIIARRIWPAQGLRFWFDSVPLPSGEGSGTFCTRNIHGSLALEPGRVSIIHGQLTEPTRLAPGLWAADCRPEAYFSPQWDEAVKHQEAQERNDAETFAAGCLAMVQLKLLEISALAASGGTWWDRLRARLGGDRWRIQAIESRSHDAMASLDALGNPGRNAVWPEDAEARPRAGLAQLVKHTEKMR